MTTRLIEVHRLGGQSPWLDNLQRGYLSSGYLVDLISQGVRGLTSNPTIFQKAIQHTSDYDAQFTSLLKTGSLIIEAYWQMVIDDIRGAADLFNGVFVESAGVDGYVSVEVDPHLAHDTEGTICAARDLRERVNRPNVMIKIPATRAGLPAFTQMIREGCPVNVTLIFSLERYQEVISAYLDGLEARLADGENVEHVHSVASFFISRVDSEIDARLEATGNELARNLMGISAVNQARLAYQMFTSSFTGSRWEELNKRGAHAQRPLWASTSTKNPSYSDTMYVDQLIGPHTVNTLPEATLAAFLDHGNVRRTIDIDIERARAQWSQLSDFGIDVGDVSDKLEREGVMSFMQSFDDLMASLTAKANL